MVTRGAGGGEWVKWGQKVQVSRYNINPGDVEKINGNYNSISFSGCFSCAFLDLLCLFGSCSSQGHKLSTEVLTSSL